MAIRLNNFTILGIRWNNKLIINLKDRRFGKLVALYPSSKVTKTIYKWRCHCDCGNEKDVQSDRLLSGNTKSCGCLVKEALAKTRCGRKINIKDKKFGSLFVVDELPYRDKRGSILWRCRCDCGNFIDTTSVKLRNGKITSCGCVKNNHYIRTKDSIDKQQQKFMNIVNKSNINIIINDKTLKNKLYESLKSCWSNRSFSRNFSVFEQRYLTPNPPTLQTIASDLGLTRERVRQIEDVSLSYLKSNWKSK